MRKRKGERGRDTPSENENDFFLSFPSLVTLNNYSLQKGDHQESTLKSPFRSSINPSIHSFLIHSFRMEFTSNNDCLSLSLDTD